MVERRPVLTFITHAVLILGVLIVAFPVYITFVASTHSAQAIVQAPMPLLPGDRFVQNYLAVLSGTERGPGSGAPVGQMMLVSLISALVISLGKIAISLLSAFAIVYFRFPLRMFFFWAVFITLMLLIPVLAITRVVPPLQVITVPLWKLAAVLLAVAVGLWLAASNVLYRDVQYLLGFLLQIWLFVSPVAFSSSLVPERWRWAYFLNPAAGVIDGMRWAVLDTPWPGRYLAISAAALLVILVGGVGWFNYAEQTFADAI